GQCPVLLDFENFAVHHHVDLGGGLSAEIEPMPFFGFEIVLHQPLLQKVRLGQRAPYLVGRMRDLAFDDDGAEFGRCVGHWSILLSRSSRSSNRLSQKPVIRLVQSASGASASSCAL